jgi:hypothetical protein
MRDELDPKLTDAISQLRDTQPSLDLWPEIARQLEPRLPRGTLLMRWPTAIAAGLAIIIATSAGTAIFVRRAPQRDTTPTVTPVSEKLSTLEEQMSPAEAALARAVDDLERAVKGTLSQLDPEARATVTRTLTMLDQAIAQAAERQHAAPDDPRATKFLTSTLRKKLNLLRTVSALTQRQS